MQAELASLLMWGLFNSIKHGSILVKCFAGPTSELMSTDNKNTTCKRKKVKWVQKWCKRTAWEQDCIFLPDNCIPTVTIGMTKKKKSISLFWKSKETWVSMNYIRYKQSIHFGKASITYNVILMQIGSSWNKPTNLKKEVSACS